MKNKSKLIFIACGGTGGHLFPGIAIAKELQKRDFRSLILISQKKIDDTVAGNFPEFDYVRLAGIGMPSLFSFRFLKFIWQFFTSLWQSLLLIAKQKPNAVFSMGGFTSLPPILAGWLLGVPSFLHEANAIPGKANRLNAKFCKKIFINFAECRKFFGRQKELQEVGMPTRFFDISQSKAEDNLRFFGFSEKQIKGRLVILVMGGSQGAHSLNLIIERSLAEFAKMPVAFIHLCGKSDVDRLEVSYSEHKIPFYVSPFLAEMEKAYVMSDLAIARSGASSLAEFAQFGLPSILIPYPHAADNHQQRNAEIFAQKSAAYIFGENLLSEKKIAEIIKAEFFFNADVELVMDSAKLKKMSAATEGFFRQDSAVAICDEIDRSVEYTASSPFL